MHLQSRDLDRLIRDLRGFDRRKEVVAQLRREMRAPLPQVRKKIRRHALATLPAGGGLNKWAAQVRVTARLRLAGRDAGLALRGTRKSTAGKADLRRMAAGRIRHPSRGRRGRGDWHTQSIAEGFFTAPAGEIDQWRTAAARAVGRALDSIGRG